MSKGTAKREALTVGRLMHEVLVGQLSIPLRQIVNDSTFKAWTGPKRPDLLISEFELGSDNEKQFIENLVAYAEVKDKCSVGDSDWLDAVKQGKLKAKELGLPYFIVTNCLTSIFYNTNTVQQISLNKNPLREFQTIDILRLVKSRLKKNPDANNIQTNVDSVSTISEAVFNKKLWELASVYRSINFKDNVQKIDFTIGFVSLEFFEEKAILDGKKDASKIYWSECRDQNDEKMVAGIEAYIRRLSEETNFKQFRDLINSLRVALIGEKDKPSLIPKNDVRAIYEIIDSMRPLHGAGFDLFGAVYEMFASSKEKKEFGEYFTRRHYTHLLAKLLLKGEEYFNKDKIFTLLDPACGTGGFLTEAFKVIKNNYELSGTLDAEAQKFLETRCLYGMDVREENISRTKLNMFLVGDGHANMLRSNTLISSEYPFQNQSFDYILSNPPYGSGTIKAETDALSTSRSEVAFLFKIRALLKSGGYACVIQPDGVLENPSDSPLRRELLETCDIIAIVSLPVFAFAPYTKEKTYAVFFRKRSKSKTKYQTSSIWMYIIDNDGLANSDKRFPTKLRNNRNGWMHDEISGWVSTEGEEMPGLLEARWLNYDDKASAGTEWRNERGDKIKERKAGHISMAKVIGDRYTSLLPEHYLRGRQTPHATAAVIYKKYQAKAIKAKEIFDVIGGNSGLTEEYIYSLLLNEGERKYKILTGSMNIDSGGYIYHCPAPNNPNKLITVYSGEGLHVVRKGKAGHVNYLVKGHYTLNDDAYIIVIKKDIDYKISLKWIARACSHAFGVYASSSANSTWNKGGFLNHSAFDIPEYDEQIDFLKEP